MSKNKILKVMKKIITLNLTILFLTISNSNALDFNEYYELPEKNKIDYSKIKNSKLFIKNQQFSNEFDDIKKHYPISKNSYENPKIIF